MAFTIIVAAAIAVLIGIGLVIWRQRAARPAPAGIELEPVPTDPEKARRYIVRLNEYARTLRPQDSGSDWQYFGRLARIAGRIREAQANIAKGQAEPLTRPLEVAAAIESWNSLSPEECERRNAMYREYRENRRRWGKLDDSGSSS
jgi:hypothetical protein